MNKRHILILLFILVAGGYALTEFSASLSPYVTISQARASAVSVQVKGKLVKENSSIWQENQMMYFTLKDENGDELPVVYSGEVPENFEHATDIVVIGTYIDGHFQAEKMLAKCPSKYQKEVSKK